jgi:hypothetical protein
MAQVKKAKKKAAVKRGRTKDKTKNLQELAKKFVSEARNIGGRTREAAAFVLRRTKGPVSEATVKGKKYSADLYHLAAHYVKIYSRDAQIGRLTLLKQKKVFDFGTACYRAHKEAKSSTGDAFKNKTVRRVLADILRLDRRIVKIGMARDAEKARK